MHIFSTPFNTPLLIALTVVYVIAASITTLDIRKIQAKRNGKLQPNEPMLPEWTGIFAYVLWLTWLVVFVLNWKYALFLFAAKFILKVLPVLELLGSLLLTPLVPRQLNNVATSGTDEEYVDEMYDWAVEFVSTLNQVSESQLQRGLKVGHLRLTTILSKLEKNGVISPAKVGSRFRDIYIHNTMNKRHEKLYNQAVKLAADNGAVSAPDIASTLNVSYGEARRIIEELQEEGIVKYSDHTKTRSKFTS